MTDYQAKELLVALKEIANEIKKLREAIEGRKDDGK